MKVSIIQVLLLAGLVAVPNFAARADAPSGGRAEDGDVIGWMNRGMDWRQISDTAGQYAITLLPATAEHADREVLIR